MTRKKSDNWRYTILFEQVITCCPDKYVMRLWTILHQIGVVALTSADYIIHIMYIMRWRMEIYLPDIVGNHREPVLAHLNCFHERITSFLYLSPENFHRHLVEYFSQHHIYTSYSAVQLYTIHIIHDFLNQKLHIFTFHFEAHLSKMWCPWVDMPSNRVMQLQNLVASCEALSRLLGTWQPNWEKVIISHDIISHRSGISLQ